MNISTNHKFTNSLLIFATLALLFSCEKEVELIIPPVDNKYVIEGVIENGLPPLVLVSKTRDYNEALSLDNFENLYLGGATVVVSHNSQRDTLDEICTDNLPPEILEQISESLGIPPNVVASTNLCAYTDLGGLTGEFNTTYGLEVNIDDEELSAQTHIPGLVELDSLWFEIVGETDSLGFVYGTFTDPDTLGNAYRWYAKRINQYPEWSARAGEQKDQQFIAPLGSAFDDTFFNGLSFDFAYYRGAVSGSTKPDDFNAESGFFKTGDTIAVKGCGIDLDTYNYVTTFESESSSGGNPFSAPAAIFTNINGGLGVWAGYACYSDSLVAIP